MWNWLKRLGQFIHSVTRRILSRPAQRELSELDLDANQDRVADLAHALAEDAITVGEWEAAMREEIKTAYIEQYLLGRGGLGQMTQADWGSIGGMLGSDQYRFLNRFAAEIAAGELSEAQIIARARMYIASSKEAFERANARARGVPGEQLPAYPGDGSTICLTNCKCFWNHRRIEERGRTLRWESTWTLRPAEHCTSGDVDARGRPLGCIQRAQLWAPYVIEV